MTPERIQQLLTLGENIAIEFKRCGNGIEADTYETVCAFLNRFGGDLFLGVENNGKVCGVPKKAAVDIVRNFVSCIHCIFKNACRAKREAEITPENLEPDAKNPRIAAFFRNLYLVDQLGSGTRRLFKYVPFYSNAKPIIKEADVFRITVPLDDSYSFDALIGESKNLFSNKHPSEVTSGVNTEVASGVASEVASEVNKEVTSEVIRLLQCQFNESRAEELMFLLKIKHKDDFRRRFIAPALKIGVLERTQPDSPRSPTQKYRLTAKGRELRERLNKRQKSLKP